MFDNTWMVAEVLKVMPKWTKVRFEGEAISIDIKLEPEQYGALGTWCLVTKAVGIGAVSAALEDIIGTQIPPEDAGIDAAAGGEDEGEEEDDDDDDDEDEDEDDEDDGSDDDGGNDDE